MIPPVAAIVPEQTKFPVVPSSVQPVSLEPPARTMEPFVPVGPILIVSFPVPVPILIVLTVLPPAPRFKVVAAVLPILTVVAVESPKARVPAVAVSSPP